MKFTSVQWQFFCRLEDLDLLDKPFDLEVINASFPVPFGVRTLRALFKKGALAVAPNREKYMVTDRARDIYFK
jgi:hypothetical protein